MQWLQGIAHQVGSMPDLRQIASTCLDQTALNRLRDQEVIEAIADLLTRDRIRLCEHRREARIVLPVAAPAIAPPRASSPKTVRPVETHWIEVVLVDEAGKPVANQAYKIVAPDGTQYTGELDGDGFVRIDGIPPGNCTISFPEIERLGPLRTR